jgi:hypothetical protein
VPARPANSSAPTTGPSSFSSAECSGHAERILRAETLQQVGEPCRPSTMPTNTPQSMMMISERAPAL